MRRLCVVLFVCVMTFAVPARVLGEPWYGSQSYVPTPIHPWSGFYGGFHLGGTWGGTDAYDSTGNVVGDYWSAAPSGLVAGVQLGYNWVNGPVLFGVEGDLGDLGLAGSAATSLIPLSYSTYTNTDAGFYMTLRGRLGIVGDQWMGYVTGGWIGADTNVSIVGTCTSFPCGSDSVIASNSEFNSGWTLGGGIEAALSNTWTWKVEYLYYDLGTSSISGRTSGGTPFRWSTETDGQLIRAGLNYRFGFGPSVFGGGY